MLSRRETYTVDLSSSDKIMKIIFVIFIIFTVFNMFLIRFFSVWSGACFKFLLLPQRFFCARDDGVWDPGTTGTTGTMHPPEHVPTKSHFGERHAICIVICILFGGYAYHTCYNDLECVVYDRQEKCHHLVYCRTANLKVIQKALSFQTWTPTV